MSQLLVYAQISDSRIGFLLISRKVKDLGPWKPHPPGIIRSLRSFCSGYGALYLIRKLRYLILNIRAYAPEGKLKKSYLPHSDFGRLFSVISGDPIGTHPCEISLLFSISGVSAIMRWTIKLLELSMSAIDLTA